MVDPRNYFRVVQWLGDRLSLHEHLEPALSFLIKSVTTVDVSDGHRMFHFIQCLQDGIEMRAMIFYHGRWRKAGTKIHLKLLGVYGGHSYSLSVVEYWVCKFRAQRTDLHDETRPGRPFTNLSARTAWLLNDERFSSTRYLARQLAVTKEGIKRNL
jgi:hypothetical protein